MEEKRPIKDILNPVFWSEISSSYLLKNIISNSQDRILIKHLFNEFPEWNRQDLDLTKAEVVREKQFPHEGHLDIYIRVPGSKGLVILAIEVKVHDYRSADIGQLDRYKRAIQGKLGSTPHQIYFIYLTQFTEEDFTEKEKIFRPLTIDAYRKAKLLNEKDPKGAIYKHMTWKDMHAFLDKHKSDLNLTAEEELILAYHKKWIESKSLDDKNNHLKMLEDCLKELNINLVNELPSGKPKGNRYYIDIEKNLSSGGEELQAINRIIKRIADSKPHGDEQINRNDRIEAKIRAHGEKLCQEGKKQLSQFYLNLLDMAAENDKIYFIGEGGRGYSVNTYLYGSPYSICTIYRDKTIAFNLRKIPRKIRPREE
jgi:hypothetical protein